MSDLTDVATWAGFAPMAFIIGTDAPRIVGWRPHAGFILDAPAPGLHD